MALGHSHALPQWRAAAVRPSARQLLGPSAAIVTATNENVAPDRNHTKSAHDLGGAHPHANKRQRTVQVQTRVVRATSGDQWRLHDTDCPTLSTCTSLTGGPLTPLPTRNASWPLRRLRGTSDRRDSGCVESDDDDMDCEAGADTGPRLTVGQVDSNANQSYPNVSNQLPCSSLVLPKSRRRSLNVFCLEERETKRSRFVARGANSAVTMPRPQSAPVNMTHCPLPPILKSCSSEISIATPQQKRPTSLQERRCGRKLRMSFALPANVKTNEDTREDNPTEEQRDRLFTHATKMMRLTAANHNEKGRLFSTVSDAGVDLTCDLSDMSDWASVELQQYMDAFEV